MTRQAPSALDRRLVATAAAAGVSLSARQLVRWRDVGLVPSADKQGLGQGHGSTTMYPPEVVDYVIELARRKGRTALHKAVLWTFLDGFDVPEECYRAAMLQLLAGLMADKVFDAEDASDQAMQFARNGAASRPRSGERSLRDPIDRTYDDLIAEGRWTDADDGAPTLREFRMDTLFELFMGIAHPGDARLDDVVLAELTHGQTSSIVDPDGAFPDLDEFEEILTAMSLDALHDGARSGSFEAFARVAQFVRTDPLLSGLMVGRSECPAPKLLLYPLFITQVAPVFERLSDGQASPS